MYNLYIEGKTSGLNKISNIIVIWSRGEMRLHASYFVSLNDIKNKEEDNFNLSDQYNHLTMLFQL